MRVEALYLRHCRAIEEASFTFGKKRSAIIGPNGSGKTTILEALYFFVAGKSFRTHRIDEMITRGQSSMAASLLFEYRGVEKEVAFTLTKEGRIFSLDREPVASFSELFGTVIAVLFSPEEGELIRGAPDCRRGFLNLALVKADPLYLWHLERYQKALRMRNALLKRREGQMASLWEEPLSLSGSYITAARKKFLEIIKPRLCHYFDLLGGESTPEISYKASEGQFERIRKRELELGYTLIGPHRDDFTLFSEGLDSRAFASEGQKQLLLMALKLAEADFLSHALDEEAILFVDEFGLHLDKKRREAILALFSTLGQVILTSTEEVDNIENSLFL